MIKHNTHLKHHPVLPKVSKIMTIFSLALIVLISYEGLWALIAAFICESMFFSVYVIMNKKFTKANFEMYFSEDSEVKQKCEK